MAGLRPGHLRFILLFCVLSCILTNLILPEVITIKQQQHENRTAKNESTPVKRTGFFPGIREEDAVGGVAELSRETRAASD